MTDKITVRGEISTPNVNHRACERRSGKRLLCSDLVQLQWTGQHGACHREIVILENLSRAGVGLFMGVPVPEGTEVYLAANGIQLGGRVKQCQFRENGYVLGLELNAESQWAQEPGSDFLPEHLLDVSLLDLE